jgi:hypothetical protein
MKNPLSYVVQLWFPKIAEINRKYSRPRLTMTPLVRRCLLALRLYLLLLVLLLAYKFITLL